MSERATLRRSIAALLDVAAPNLLLQRTASPPAERER